MIFVRAAWLAAIYLLVLTSVEPGDLAIGAALGLAVAFALRTRGGARPSPRAVAGMLGSTGAEVVRGTWRTARFCLGAPANPGLVEIPRGDRSPERVALWGVLTGEAPDEYPVDAEGDALFVHVLDASDPDAVRARHERTDRRWQRRVVP
ncbi:MAG TPA: Na+/H+ antiporter subunit E [Solirubrobacter sp.]|nr:Na+/H+ antiporter subunit E [Solirubrobacter sp.]